MHRVDDLERNGIELSDEDPLPIPMYPEPPITLEELKRCLIEDLDLTLDSPGKPATFDTSRVSRDPEHWTALATFGHPAIESALASLAERVADDRSPLVVGELGSLAIAYRADRTPPERVKQVSELFDLGSPVSKSEAEKCAADDLKATSELLLLHEQELAGVQRERWLRQIRLRLKRLVAQAIYAEAVIRRRRYGEAPDLHLVWMDLTSDAKDGWENADVFRQWLELEPTELIPHGAPGADDRPDRDLAKVRTETGRALVELIREWMAIAKPEGAS
jgi:hypothetical protein